MARPIAPGFFTGSRHLRPAMTSQRWSTLVPGLVFALVLTTGDSTRAQWGYPGTSGFAAAGQFGLGYGAVPGISPVGYGPYGAGDFFGTSNFIGFPQPGYAESIGQWPLTTTSLQTVSETGLDSRQVNAVPPLIPDPVDISIDRLSRARRPGLRSLPMSYEHDHQDAETGTRGESPEERHQAVPHLISIL